MNAPAMHDWLIGKMSNDIGFNCFQPFQSVPNKFWIEIESRK